jgi:hypothetical protein
MPTISATDAISQLQTADLVVIVDQEGNSTIAHTVGWHEEGEADSDFTVGAAGLDDLHIGRTGAVAVADGDVLIEGLRLRLYVRSEWDRHLPERWASLAALLDALHNGRNVLSLAMNNAAWRRRAGIDRIDAVTISALLDTCDLLLDTRPSRTRRTKSAADARHLERVVIALRGLRLHIAAALERRAWGVRSTDRMDNSDEVRTALYGIEEALAPPHG